MSKKMIAVFIGAMVVAATAITPALGGPSLNQMVKDEVAKVSKKKAKRGPKGEKGEKGDTGPAGSQGPKGADGSARAYALVAPGPNPTSTTASRTKGIDTVVAHPSGGVYCVNAPGIDPLTAVAVVTVDDTTSTTVPEGNGAAHWSSSGGAPCAAGTFKVDTWRIPNGTPPPDDYAFNDGVGFSIVIP